MERIKKKILYTILMIKIFILVSCNQNIKEQNKSEFDNFNKKQLISNVSYDVNNNIQIRKYFDKMIPQLLEDYHVPGVVISIVGDGDIKFKAGYGYANVEHKQSADPDTSIFRITSIGKLFTWTAIMQLVEQDKIDLDKDINEYLDTFKIPDTFPEPITMKHLLTHTAGFEDCGIGIGRDTVDKIPSLGEYLKNNMPKRLYPPGKYIAYSNYGAGLAGYIMERISGIKYEEYIQKRILDPLGMTHTTAYEPLPENLESLLASSYYYSGKSCGFVFDVMKPDGSMSATASDMAKFMIAHLQNGTYNGIRILKVETAIRMHSSLYKHHPLLNGYAYGFQEQNRNGLRIIGHLAGWENFRNHLSILPEKKIGIFISSNGEMGFEMNYQIFSKFIDDFFPDDKINPINLDPDFKYRANKYTGFYLDRLRNYNSLEKLTWLLNTIPVKLTDNNTLLILNEEWVEIDHLLFRKPDKNQFILFEEDKNKKIIGLHYYGDYGTQDLEKISWFHYPMFQLRIIILFIIILILYIGFTGLVIIKKYILKKESYKLSIEQKKERKSFQELNIILLTMITSIICLFTFFLLIINLYGNLRQYVIGIPLSLKIITCFPLIIFLSTVIIIFKTIKLWKKNKYFLRNNIYFNIVYLLTILSLLGFCFLFYYWNIIIWKVIY